MSTQSPLRDLFMQRPWRNRTYDEAWVFPDGKLSFPCIGLGTSKPVVAAYNPELHLGVVRAPGYTGYVDRSRGSVYSPADFRVVNMRDEQRPAHYGAHRATINFLDPLLTSIQPFDLAPIPVIGDTVQVLKVSLVQPDCTFQPEQVVAVSAERRLVMTIESGVQGFRGSKGRRNVLRARLISAIAEGPEGVWSIAHEGGDPILAWCHRDCWIPTALANQSISNAQTGVQG